MSDNSPAIDPTLPAIVQEMLRRGERLEKIRLAADGTWWHEGEPFSNDKIIGLFNRSVGRTDGGTWVLQIGRYTYPIEVEATGWFVERVDLDAEPPHAYLSDGTNEALAVDTLRYLGDGHLRCHIHAGRHEARLKRSAYYALAEHVVERDGRLLFRGQVLFRKASF